jgi:hypothetical protein
MLAVRCSRDLAQLPWGLLSLRRPLRLPVGCCCSGCADSRRGLRLSAALPACFSPPAAAASSEEAPDSKPECLRRLCQRAPPAPGEPGAGAGERSRRGCGGRALHPAAELRRAWRRRRICNAGAHGAAEAHGVQARPPRLPLSPPGAPPPLPPRTADPSARRPPPCARDASAASQQRGPYPRVLTRARGAPCRRATRRRT